MLGGMSSKVRRVGQFFGSMFLILGILSCVFGVESQSCLILAKVYGHPIKLLYYHDDFDYPTGMGWTFPFPLWPVVFFAFSGIFFIIRGLAQKYERPNHAQLY